MYLIDGPYVSEYLKQALASLQVPVIQTPAAIRFLKDAPVRFISEADALSELQRNPKRELYTNSENALDWLYENLPDHDLTETIHRVKDKVLFRQMLEEIHNDYYYRGVSLSGLSEIAADTLPYPVILKPSVGFFSLGVQSVENADEWHKALSNLNDIIRTSDGLYPKRVLNNSSFIIEEVINGDEFAVDCYYDEKGHVVILNLMKHLFASGADVNDRVYITSGALMRQYLKPVAAYLDTLGKVFQLTNFQAHIEIRIDTDQVIRAIEINPLRFGGWCSTPDLAQYAWDMNIYDSLVNKKRPNWSYNSQLYPDSVTALIVLNNSTGVSGKKIKKFNYDALLADIQEPLELRKTDFRKFPLFGFLMCRVPANNMDELYRLLHSDLNEYISA